MRVGAGSAIVDAGRNQAAGAFQATGDPLSIAIAGPGFFQVRRSDGCRRADPLRRLHHATRRARS